MKAAHIREGLRIFRHALATRVRGPARYNGDAAAVCRAVVERCWDARLGIFVTSPNNYPVFYARDFGMCVDALLSLGHRTKVRKTLTWALAQYKKHGRFALIIGRDGVPFNFPDIECPDGYAFFLHSLVALGDKGLVRKQKVFLEQELARFCAAVVDSTTGLVRRGLRVGGMRDYAIRDSSCYDNAAVAAIKRYADLLGLAHPLKKYDYPQLLLDQFWTGTHFTDDSVNDELTGDANVAPLWFGIFPPRKEKELFALVSSQLAAAGLDKPAALRYEPHRNASVKMSWLDALAGGWERDTIWMHLGNLYLQVAARHDRKLARSLLATHTAIIEREHHYPEVLHSDGTPFRSLFFHADDSMLWAANFLSLQRELTNRRKQNRRK